MQNPPPLPETVEGELEYEVENILGMKEIKTSSRANKKLGAQSTHRNITIKREFFVKWAGYGMEHCTWEPEAHLENSKDVIQDFLKAQQAVMERKAERKISKKN